MIERTTAHSVAEIVMRLTEAIRRRGLELFARIDHAAGARGAGLELADEVVLVFGNAKGGTPLMQRDPLVGYELPLRLLVFARGDATVIAWRDPHELAGAYALGDADETLGRLSALLDQLAGEAGAG